MHAGYRETALPIVGMGGVAGGRHALELIAAGASDVALGTVLFADPGAPTPGPERAGGRAGGARLRRLLTTPSGVAHAAGRRDPRPEVETKVVKNPCILAQTCWVDRGGELLESRAVAALKTQAQAPLRSLDQRMEALKRANDIRVRRAQLKKDLKAGDARIEEILSNPPEYV